jgi:hypothetical protein
VEINTEQTRQSRRAMTSVLTVLSFGRARNVPINPDRF